MDQEKIISIVMKYAEKHKNFWGCPEYVHQDDDASFDAIDMFSDIIAALPEQEDE